MSGFLDKAAKVISYIFNPLLLPSVGLLIIFNSGTYLSYIPFEGKKMIFTILFTGTFIIPVSFIPLYIYFNLIKDIEITSTRQRIAPFLITFLLYVGTFYLLRNMPIPFINIFLLATCVCLALNIIILPFWKISSHLIGLGGLAGLLFGLTFRLNADIPLYVIGVFILSGLVASARLKLNVHNPSQVYLGFLLGFVVVGSLLFFV